MSIAGKFNAEFRRARGGRNNPLAYPPQPPLGSPLPAINVQAGTLKGADSSFGFFLDDEAITVAAGATLDLAGNSTEIADLSGGGSVIEAAQRRL